MAQPSKRRITTATQLDSVFTSLQVAWERHVLDSLLRAPSTLPKEVLFQLDAYTYFFTLFNLTGDYAFPLEVEHRLFTGYLLPALQKDTYFVRTQASIPFYHLLWRGSLSTILDIGTRLPLEKEEFDSFYRLSHHLDTLLSAYRQVSDQEFQHYAQRLQGVLAEHRDDMEAKQAFLLGQPDAALVYLITGLANRTYLPSRAASMGKTLVDYYGSHQQPEKGYALLANLFLGTNVEELPRDTLANWYRQLDPVKGPEFYQQVVQKTAGITFVSRSEKKVTFPKKWHLLSQPTSVAPIEKATYLLLDFWYSGCGPCLKEIPELNQLQEVLKSRKDIIFLSINTDKQLSSAERAIKKYGIKFPVVYEGDQLLLTNQLGVQGYPAKFIVSTQGKLITKGDNSAMTLQSWYDFIKAKP